ncbi:S-adenosyl-L-methionine-dependent methyltransferase, partial [Thozetella sp. PMI_491]
MTSSKTLSRMVQLAASITASVAEIQEFLSAHDIASPSFDEDAPLSLPREVSAAQNVVLDATAELHDLLLEPMSLLYLHGGHINSACFQAITRFGIANLVPASGRATFAEIAERIQPPVPEQMVARLLRHAMTMHVFCEPEPGVVAHTKASKLLTNPTMNDWLRAGTHEMWPAATRLVDALETWPGSEEPNHTGFVLANNTTDSIYEIIGKSPERAGRFANAMKAFVTRADYDPSYLTDHYDWAALGSVQVVDIGGAQGHIAMALASRFSNLNILVQDMDKIIEGAEAGVPEALKDRVRFEAHDFFAPQTTSADILLFRWVLHNWSDKHCRLVLQSQIPMLKPGTRMIIQDTFMPESAGAVPLWKERSLRADDLTMAAAFNSRERTPSQWKALIEGADPRFVVTKTIAPEGSALGILEVIWK